MNIVLFRTKWRTMLPGLEVMFDTSVASALLIELRDPLAYIRREQALRNPFASKHQSLRMTTVCDKVSAMLRTVVRGCLQIGHILTCQISYWGYLNSEEWPPGIASPRRECSMSSQVINSYCDQRSIPIKISCLV